MVTSSVSALYVRETRRLFATAIAAPFLPDLRRVETHVPAPPIGPLRQPTPATSPHQSSWTRASRSERKA
jgi:hypothetical protein